VRESVEIGGREVPIDRPKTAHVSVRKRLLTLTREASVDLFSDPEFRLATTFAVTRVLEVDGVLILGTRDIVPLESFPEPPDTGLKDWDQRFSAEVGVLAVPMARKIIEEGDVSLRGLLVSSRLPRGLAAELVPSDVVTEGTDIIHSSWKWDAVLPERPEAFEYRLQLEMQFDEDGLVDAFSADDMGFCFSISEDGTFPGGRVVESLCLGKVMGSTSAVVDPRTAGRRMDVSLETFAPAAQAWVEKGIETGVPPAQLAGMRAICVEPVFVGDNGELTLSTIPQTAMRVLGAPAGPIDAAALTQQVWADHRKLGSDALIVTFEGPTQLRSPTASRSFTEDDVVSFWVSPHGYYLRAKSDGETEYYMLEQGHLIDIMTEAAEA